MTIYNDEYRIDKTCGHIYKHNTIAKAFVFFASTLAAGTTKRSIKNYIDALDYVSMGF
jgi:hypothetical protein